MIKNPVIKTHIQAGNFCKGKQHHWSTKVFKSANGQLLFDTNTVLNETDAYVSLSSRVLRRVQRERQDGAVQYVKCLTCPTIKVITQIPNGLLDSPRLARM
ncbi:MAG TPA: hypothetical protein VJH70_01765 [Candidatus Paceibacterota bacterium]